MAASDTALPMPDYDWRRVRGLETLFSKGRLLEDRDLDQIPDVMNLHFVIPEDAEDFVYEAACNLAFRMEWRLPLTRSSDRRQGGKGEPRSI